MQIGPEVLGLLIINDFCNTHFEERKQKQIDRNHLKLAKLRT